MKIPLPSLVVTALLAGVGSSQATTIAFSKTAVPEPSTCGMMLGSLLAMVIIRRRALAWGVTW